MDAPSHDPATAATLVQNFPTLCPGKYGFRTSFSKSGSRSLSVWQAGHDSISYIDAEKDDDD
jgi:hypothetical protein